MSTCFNIHLILSILTCYQLISVKLSILFTSTFYYLILIKKLTAKYHPYDFIKWLFVFGSIMVFPFGYSELSVVEWGSFPAYIWFSIGFVIVFATFGTYLLNPMALRNLKATTVSTFLYLQPIFAGLFAVFMGSDQIDTVKGLAALLIFIGVYLVTKK